MKKRPAFALALAACLLVACDQDCPITGSPNTTYFYTYLAPDGLFHLGDVTTNENGNGIVGEVPSDVDCSKIVLKEDQEAPFETPPVV